VVAGTTEAVVTIEDGRAARLEVEGARLHVPADVAKPDRGVHGLYVEPSPLAW